MGILDPAGFVPISPAYCRQMERLGKTEHALLQGFGERDRKRFQAYLDLQSDCMSLQSQEDFSRGFSLGVRLMAEALGIAPPDRD